MQPAQACSSSAFLLAPLLVSLCRGSSSQMYKVERLLPLSAATVTCKLTFAKVLLFIPAFSRLWKRSSVSVILTVVDANSFLVVYFYMFTLWVCLPLFSFALMLLCMIEFRLHKNYIWCFTLSYLIELVSLWRKRHHLSCQAGGSCTHSPFSSIAGLTLNLLICIWFPHQAKVANITSDQTNAEEQASVEASVLGFFFSRSEREIY